MRLRIAGLYLDIDCSGTVAERLPNLRPFIAAGDRTYGNLSLCCIRTGCIIPEEDQLPIQVFRREEKLFKIWLTPEHYRISIRYPVSGHSYTLQADRRWTTAETDLLPDSAESLDALNDFIQIAFIYSSAFRDTVLIHASCVMHRNRGCAFVGPSGIGKSTHARLWLQHFPGTVLLNDDQPVLRLMPDRSVTISGSPWSGKTGCYINKSAGLEAVFFMEQAEENSLKPLDGIDTFKRLLVATSLTGRDTVSFEAISKTVAEISGMVPGYILKNRPDRDAALLSYRAFARSASNHIQ